MILRLLTKGVGEFSSSKEVVMLVRVAATLASVLLVSAAPAQVTYAPNDPGIVWSEFMAASITATRADFTRPGTAAACCADMSPGVRATFRTDATLVEATVDYISLTLLPNFSVEVDGVLQAPFGHSVLGPATFTVTSQPTPVSRVVSIIWPIGADVDLLSIRLTGGSAQFLQPPPIRPRQRAVCFGDSITHGAFASEPALSYPGLLATQRNWSVVNAGFSAHFTVGSDGTSIGALAPTFLVLAIGSNDFGGQRPLAAFQADYDLWIANFRAAPGCSEVPIVCVTPIVRSDEFSPPILLESYRDRIRQVVATRGTTDPNLHLLEGWDMVPADPLLFPDGLHPNDTGFAFYGSAIAALNLVHNPGFEPLLLGLFGGFHWEDLGGTAISTTTFFSGAQSLQVGTGGARRQTIHGLAAGKCFDLTAMAQVTNAADVGRISIEFLDASGIVVATQSVNVTTTTWQPFALSGTAPTGAVRGRIVLDKPTGPGSMFVDDVALPLCEPGTSFEFPGCAGLNPTGSLVVLSGRPAFGTTFQVGLDNPLGTQTSALPVLVGSMAADTAFPCGTNLPGFGLAGPGTSGEVLLDLTSIATLTGPTWVPGFISPVNVTIPATCTLAGVKMYLQGVMCDSSFCGLTNAVEVTIGG